MGGGSILGGDRTQGGQEGAEQGAAEGADGADHGAVEGDEEAEQGWPKVRREHIRERGGWRQDGC